MRIRHFLLTRFNLLLWDNDKKGNATLTEEWLHRRCELFETYCLPSIMSQKGTDLEWVILFDRDTPADVMERKDRWCEQCPSIHVVTVQHEMGYRFLTVFQRVVARKLRKLSEEGVRYDRIITTYLDNDDALSSDFTERVQALAREVKVDQPTFITFAYGCQYYTDLNIVVRFRYTNNHFLSLVEVPDEQFRVRTVFGYGMHDQLYTFSNCHVQTVSTKEQPAWLEVVHENNVMNDVLCARWPSLIRRRDALSLFSIPVTTSSSASTIYRFRFFPKWVYSQVKWLKRKLTSKKQASQMDEEGWPGADSHS